MRNQRKKSKTTEQPPQQKEDGTLPPRRKVHPNNKMQMIHLFYNILIGLFILLIAGSVAYGIHWLE